MYVYVCVCICIYVCMYVCMYNSTWYPYKGAEPAKQEDYHVIEYD